MTDIGWNRIKKKTSMNRSPIRDSVIAIPLVNLHLGLKAKKYFTIKFSKNSEFVFSKGDVNVSC